MNSIDLGLTILIYATIIVLVILGVFLAKLFYDLSKLAQTAQSTSEIIQTELEPTLKELREAAGSLKSIASSADTNISGLKKAISNAFDTSFQVGHKMKGLMAGLVKGLCAGLKIFKK